MAKQIVLQATQEKMKQLPQTRHKKGSNDSNKNKDSLDFALTREQSKYTQTLCNLMAPSGPELNHPAAPLLLELATLEYSSDTGDQWHMEFLEAAIRKGAHQSEMVLEVAEKLRTETLEKVEQQCTCLVRWANIKDNPLRNLKVSPISAIPHKSRLFRMILDLPCPWRTASWHLISVSQ
jgi:hypothetical protein